MPGVDNRNKRASAIGIDLTWFRVWPNPDGTIDVNDRQQSAYKYSGTVTASTSSSSGVNYYRTLLGVGI